MTTKAHNVESAERRGDGHKFGAVGDRRSLEVGGSAAQIEQILSNPGARYTEIGATTLAHLNQANQSPVNSADSVGTMATKNSLGLAV